MIATGSKLTGRDFCKGLAVIATIYGILALVCLVLVAT